MPELTTQQIEDIQIDYGILYVDFGEVGERLLGPTRGGGSFDVKAKYREIEFDGRKGMTKGTKVLEELDAMLGVTLIDTSIDNMQLAMPFLTRVENVLTAKSAAIGVVPASAYKKNITMFAKLISGLYKKITLYNPMSQKDFSLAAKPKGEGEIGFEFNANWDPTDDTADLYKIEDVASIGGDVTAPTAITVPVDGATAIVVTANLTATFSEDVKAEDINTNNFILMKASDASVIAGALTYTTKVATFNPTASLEAATAYIWVVSNVRDLAGNKMLPVTINFTTA